MWGDRRSIASVEGANCAMKQAQLIGIAVAGVCGLGAFFLMKSIVSKPREIQREVHTNTTEVLVARANIGLGHVATESSFRWQAWPEDGVPSGAITRRGGGNPMKDLVGGIARAPMMAGEPVTKAKLVKAGEGGVLASILPAGMRAISTKITDDTAVGKMILPNDHVDVILTRRLRGRAGGDDQVSDTLFRNVRVLAIGQQLEPKEGKKGADGTTATLELTPEQAEQLALAKSMGEISLALRSIADFVRDGQGPSDTNALKRSGQQGNAIKFMRYGHRTRAYGVN
jgi:pilus assembly protein CpaB